MTTATAPGTHPHSEEFVDVFTRGWARGANGGLDIFTEHFADDVVLKAPLMRTTRGIAAARKAFEPLFEAIPDLHGTVVSWGPTSDGALIELRLQGTVGGRTVEWTTVDRVILDDEGRLVSRIAHFDPLPLVLQMLRSPLASARLLPSLLGLGGGR